MIVNFVRYLIPELGPCSLKIIYSTHTDLSVKFQSHCSRDYTNPLLPVAPAAIDASGQYKRKVLQPKGGLHVTASSAKKILIMGGTRFIGVFLSRLLVKEGHQVTLFTRGKAPITRGWEEEGLINELTQGMEFTKRLKNHLDPLASPESRELLLQKIISSYDKTLLMLHWEDLVEEFHQVATGILEDPQALTGVSQRTEASDQHFKDQYERLVYKKRRI